MIVYRDQRSRAEPRYLLDKLGSRIDRLAARSATAHESIVDAVVDAGMLESGVADAVFPETDGIHPLTDALRRVSVGLGHLLWHCWNNDADLVERWREGVLHRLEEVGLHRLPPTVELTVPEGFAYYAVFPEAYLEAARRCRHQIGQFSAICVGLRSIGAPLSGVVAAALEELGCPVKSVTLRPRGHPFSRRPLLAPALEQVFTEDPQCRFLLIDEGPGISGSSLSGVAEALGQMGVPDELIIFFPSWQTDGGHLESAEAREHWRRHQQFTVDFQDLWMGSGRLARAVPGSGWQELSAGAWRGHLYQDPRDYPAVQPQHERRKYLVQRDHNPLPMRSLLSFAGLGSRSAPIVRRAERLAEAGFSPRPEGVVHGFLIRPFVIGCPVPKGGVDSCLVETVAQYLAHLSSSHRTEPTVSGESLGEMVRTNVAEGLGDEWQERLGAFSPSPAECWTERPVALDGRMQSHEWIRTSDGYMKVDAFDHHDDHFFPGCQDIAWDLAGVVHELDLHADGRQCLIERYSQLSGDHTIEARLPFYSVSYLAYRLGYSKLAGHVLGESPDGNKFRFAAERYAHLLRRELIHGPRVYWNV
jgi:hypothetical protein